MKVGEFGRSETIPQRSNPGTLIHFSSGKRSLLSLLELEGKGMESFTRRVEADDEPDTTEFSTMSSDNGFISSEDLRSEVSSNNVHDEGLLSADSTGSKSPSPKRMAMFEGPEILQRLNVFEEVEHGGRVAFECQCKAHPMPVYKWYKDDAELVESDRLKVEDFLEMDGTLRLIISNVRKSDEGAYRCKLENQEGVAASTGYLSVTGNNSSPNAVSTPPLLRAITEESNVSTDSDEGASSSSATLEKILTGEYDVSALPYSQYLELLKDSGALKPNTGSIEKNGGSRTPTEDTPQADDVKNLCTDFPYDAHTTVTDDDDVNSFEDLTVTMATNDTEMDAEEIVNKPRSEVIFGTPFLTDSKTVFFIEGSRKEDVSSDEVDTESSKNSDENAEEMATERGPGFSLEGGTLCGDNIAKTTGYEVDVEFESRIGEPSTGDFREEGVFDSLDEKKMKETMIAGRIGMPSDWEFAHYTEEGPDEVEDTLSCVPDEVDTTPDLPIETIGSKYEEEKAVREVELGVSSLASESAIPAAENLEKREVLLRGVALLRDSLLGGNAQETGDLEKIVDERKEEATVVPENSDESVTSSFLAEKSTSLAAEEDITRNEKAGVEDDFRLTSSDPKMLTDIESTEFKSEVNGEITEESKPEGKPEIDGASKWMPVMTPFANVVSGVSNLANWSANSATPEEVDAQTHRPDVAGSNGDQPIQSTNTTGFHFSNLMSDLTPSATAISDWIPDVSISSYLPSLSPEPLVSEGKPVDVEEVVPEFVADEAEQESKSVIDWCVDWFRYPTIFYVVLVLTMTLLASATQMNPAMVILVVAICSLVGFRLFPVHG